MVSKKVEFASLGIDVSDPVDLVRQGAFEGKNGLVVVEKKRDVGLFPGEPLDELYLDRIEVLGLVDQDVRGRYCPVFMIPEFFESEKQKVVVVESQPLKSFIFLEELSYLFPFFN